MKHEPEYPVVVAARRVIADRVVELTFRITADDLPTWEPGAHVDVILGPDLVRQYSLCGDPQARDTLTIAVLHEEVGRGGSTLVHEKVAVGDRLRIRGPRNNFPLRDAKEYLFIAGGIGITPLLPMIRMVAARGGKWALEYCGRATAGMAYVEELSGLDGVRIHPSDRSGPLDLSTVLGTVRPGVHVYCCGPERLLAEVEQRCAAWPSDSVHVERFAAGQVESEVDEMFEVRCAQSKIDLMVPPGSSILEIAEQAGVQVLSSCREGTCGTCETVVLEGTPDHRDSLLSPQERQANEVMMICCSRSLGSRLVLEL
ncbi:PDR/VanB family oxidoreductase [Nocardia coffeae]|uniref:PDR/VanB family oxidoreductase n=1 Tax=Nocardia coffeae TaxID=2873381 RepID=UPI0027E166F6|nr:PDR/VanB family oxidoreductase [Nocardia coffeae]